MRSLHARRPVARRSRFVLAGLVTAALVLSACGADESFAPAAASGADGDVSAAPSAEAAEAALGALTISPRIAFASYRIGDHPDIYRMDPPGTNVTRLTSFAGDEVSPAMSWDHKRIAFVRRRVDASNVGRDDIYLVNVDGTGKRWARTLTSTFPITDPAWSPDGTRLVVTVFLQGTPLLATLTLATGKLDLVSGWNGAIVGRQGSYHPDGKSIIFVDETGKQVRQIYPNGDEYPLVDLNVPVGHPTFSPDGKMFAYNRLIAGTNNTEIFVQNRSTNVAKRLTYAGAYDGWATWSPDGTKLAFESRRSGQNQIWTMSATGGTATRITHTTTIEGGPSWSH
jgi:Tol biopolymer transport system component